MKKFKLTWDERVCNDEGDTLHFEGKSQIIEAENADTACTLWEEENKHNDCQNGLDDCVEIVESSLFEKHMFIDMPDGLTYGIPIEIIARNHAEYYAKEYEGDIAECLRDNTIPLFIDDYSEIRDWASNNMNWSDVKKHAITLTKKINQDEFQDSWVNGEWMVK